MRTLVLAIIAIVCAAFAWHMLLFSGRTKLGGVHVNPVTDMVTVNMLPDQDASPRFTAIASGIAYMTVVPVEERKFSNFARQYFDVYAMVLPYRIRIVQGAQ